MLKKKFYESLYKSHRGLVQQTENSFNFKDLPIPKLSEDYRKFGEGVITLDECSKVLNSFALNKAPGNDGLPVEFYPAGLKHRSHSTGHSLQVIVLCFGK